MHDDGDDEEIYPCTDGSGKGDSDMEEGRHEDESGRDIDEGSRESGDGDGFCILVGEEESGDNFESDDGGESEGESDECI